MVPHFIFLDSVGTYLNAAWEQDIEEDENGEEIYVEDNASQEKIYTFDKINKMKTFIYFAKIFKYIL